MDANAKVVNIPKVLDENFGCSKWLDTNNDEEVASFQVSFWGELRDAVNSDQYWSERIKLLRDAPEERLKLAINYLPLPGAFLEAAIALRFSIRAKRKNKEYYLDHLSLLYWLAAINSLGIPYSKVSKIPGYNIFESIPGSIIKSLEFDYKTLGYKKLGLLKTTDTKWLVEALGEPKKHSTLHKIHNSIWVQYELRFKNCFDNKMLSTWEELFNVKNTY